MIRKKTKKKEKKEKEKERERKKHDRHYQHQHEENIVDFFVNKNKYLVERKNVENTEKIKEMMRVLCCSWIGTNNQFIKIRKNNIFRFCFTIID